MARLVKLQTSLGNTRDHTKAVFEELAARFEIHFAWGYGATGDHNKGRALDVMAYSLGGGVNNPGPIRAGWNRTVVDYLLANRERLGIAYIIYDTTIISRSPKSVTGVPPWSPKKYTGTSHANHVHISFLDKPPAYRPPTTEKEPEDMSDPKVSLGKDVQKEYGYSQEEYYQSQLVADSSWRTRHAIRQLTRVEEKADRIIALLEGK